MIAYGLSCCNKLKGKSSEGGRLGVWDSCRVGIQIDLLTNNTFEPLGQGK